MIKVNQNQFNMVQFHIDQIEKINPNYKKKTSFSIEETSEIIELSLSTLYRQRKEGIGIEWRRKGRKILYPKVAIAEYMANTIKTA